MLNSVLQRINHFSLTVASEGIFVAICVSVCVCLTVCVPSSVCVRVCISRGAGRQMGLYLYFLELSLACSLESINLGCYHACVCVCVCVYVRKKGSGTDIFGGSVATLISSLLRACSLTREPMRLGPEPQRGWRGCILIRPTRLFSLTRKGIQHIGGGVSCLKGSVLQP